MITGAGRAGRKTEIGVIKEDVYQSYQEELAEITKKFNIRGSRRCRLDPLDKSWPGGQ